MHPATQIAIKAARSAGTIILRYLDRVESLDISSKGRNDFVCQVDREAEAGIISTLRKAFPHHGILAEESGTIAGDGDVWIIDPLDGTTNFLHGFPQFAVSIALLQKGRLEVGVVFDPLRNELFTASRGKGAQLNERRIRVSKAKGLEGALLGTGFPFRNPQHLDDYLKTFKAFHQPTAGIRRAGSAALDLAYVANGRLDGFWEIGLKPWDMAAGALLVQEAGGLVSDFSGGEAFLETGNLVAATPKVFQAMITTLPPLLPQALKK